MKYIRKENNVEKVYLVYYDRGNLKSFKDRIEKKFSYIHNGNIIKPQLVSIIQHILFDDSNGIDELINYVNSDDFITIDKKILQGNNELNKIDSFDINKKIIALSNLKELYENKKSMRYFNVNLLRQYYLRVCASINISLVDDPIIVNIKTLAK